MESRLHSDNLPKVFDTAVQGCERVHTILDRIIKTNLEKQLPLDK